MGSVVSRMSVQTVGSLEHKLYPLGPLLRPAGLFSQRTLKFLFFLVIFKDIIYRVLGSAAAIRVSDPLELEFQGL